jgi:hypothetical protein
LVFSQQESLALVTAPSRIGALVFDFVSSGRALSGMLVVGPADHVSRQSRRRNAETRCTRLSPLQSGIPICTLALGLFWAICNDLKNASRAMKNSTFLRREIRGATLMGISYCP